MFSFSPEKRDSLHLVRASEKKAKTQTWPFFFDAPFFLCKLCAGYCFFFLRIVENNIIFAIASEKRKRWNIRSHFDDMF